MCRIRRDLIRGITPHPAHRHTAAPAAVSASAIGVRHEGQLGALMSSTLPKRGSRGGRCSCAHLQEGPTDDAERLTRTGINETPRLLEDFWQSREGLEPA